MAKANKNIRNFFLPAVFFIPFTLYFILFTAALLLANRWLLEIQKTPGSSFTDILGLLIKVAFWFTLILLLFAFLSVMVSFLLFLFKKKRGKIHFSIASSASIKSTDGKQKQCMNIEVTSLLKPLMGFVKLRLQYDGKNFSGKFILAETGERKFISTTYKGDYLWSLPEIKEYQVEKLILYFEDFFQFFSFTIALPVQNRFYTKPLQEQASAFTISPRRTENTDSRIEELKKVEGEFLNYKNFEGNDDVRRIVWKIYAKNKELVVRIPEVLDPYASHAYLYASFFTSYEIGGNKTVEIFFLNYYKTMLWAIYQKLTQQGFQVRYIADQETPAANFNDENKAVEYALSTSKWHMGKDLKRYINTKDASIIVVTSLSDADDVQHLFDRNDGNIFFVFIKLSGTLQKSYFIGLLKWLFIQQEHNDLENYKTNWQLSLLRPKVLKNEKKLETMFSKYAKTLVI